MFFWHFLDTISSPQEPKHSSLRPGRICWHQQTPELILIFPFLQPISYKVPSENRHSNNLLWCRKQQRLLLEECAGLQADRTSTNSICLFWHTGRKEEPCGSEKWLSSMEFIMKTLSGTSSVWESTSCSVRNLMQQQWNLLIERWMSGNGWIP